ncbi:MAG TPA: MFS transporter [Anaerolineales bacterium]|nr:MFS transporter [Anaerolineales bacterium]
MGRPRTDLLLLFSSRALRLFGYGFLSVNLALYLSGLGLPAGAVGAVLSLALLGDVALSLLITTSADRLGRRRMLRLGALLIVFAGLVLATTQSPWLIGAAALVGVLSPSGNEVGPFLSIEQAALTQITPDRERTRLFAWYNLAGSLATALGALISGLAVSALVATTTDRQGAYRSTIGIYAFIGVCLGVIFFCLSSAVEAPPSDSSAPRRLGLHRSRPAVLRLSSLFALDAFAGAFLVQSLLAYWITMRFSVPPAALGGIFFAANLLAGFSGLIAGRLARRFGLINTMVFTHLPSNILLMLVPIMPTLSTSMATLLLRYSISQMDVPTRQSYTMAVVAPDERAAAAGVTTTARSLGALLSPTLSAQLMAVPGLAAIPFFVSGGLKILYDLLIYRGFRGVKPPEEVEAAPPR